MLHHPWARAARANNRYVVLAGGRPAMMGAVAGMSSIPRWRVRVGL